MSHLENIRKKSVFREILKENIISKLLEYQNMSIAFNIINHAWTEAGLRTFCKQHGWSCKKIVAEKVWSINKTRGKKWNR